MEGILGKKLGITQIFTEDGATVPVTVVEAGPCVVIARRTREKDGYEAVQVGLVEAKPPRKVTKPMQGHFKKAGVTPTREVAEFRISGDESLAPGDQIKVSIFAEKEYVDVTGTSKGKGFQGTVKRHGFGGGRATHGSMFHRAPGSIGGSSNPSRVFPGMKGTGRMGGDRVTTKNLLVVKIDEEKNLIYLRGAVPGAPNAFVAIKRAKRG
ncbi:MAG: 50S ribosomal protein L3 [Thermoanaerobaculia bacterium]|jgi:large subunit ribosomal protein L3|nr:MAG: 50S ribosomal protein L3 [Thermoanaerobaculia bacterium]MBZ0101315.1 50S ribosomal protein L3 [Thermoanaerobaculia bacterium]